MLTDQMYKVYRLCEASPMSYARNLFVKIEEVITGHMALLQQELSGVDDEQLLVEYSRQWQKFYRATKHSNALFAHVNRHA